MKAKLKDRKKIPGTRKSVSPGSVGEVLMIFMAEKTRLPELFVVDFPGKAPVAVEPKEVELI